MCTVCCVLKGGSVTSLHVVMITQRICYDSSGKLPGKLPRKSLTPFHSLLWLLHRQGAHDYVDKCDLTLEMWGTAASMTHHYLC